MMEVVIDRIGVIEGNGKSQCLFFFFGIFFL
jgi:hypothetical protein